MKKPLIICLYCVIFSLISVPLCFAGGGKDKKKGNAATVSSVANDADNEPAPRAIVFPDNVTQDNGLSAEDDDFSAADDDLSSAIVVEDTGIVAEDTGFSAAAAEDTGAPSAAVAESVAAAAGHAANAAASEVAAATSAANAAASEAAAAGHAASASAAASSPAANAPPPRPPARTESPALTFVFPQGAPSAAGNPPAAAAPPAPRRAINVIPAMPHPQSNSVFRVQVGAFSNVGLAQRCFDQLRSAGFEPFYEQTTNAQYGVLYRVVLVGVRASDMTWVVQRLEASGFNEVWLREER